MKASLVRRIRRLPRKPGVYLFKDRKGRVLYIGKAKSLRQRVSCYTRTAGLEPRISRMVAQVDDVEILEAPSEIDALMVEARLIRDIQPKYNAEQKDDKSFTLLEVTTFDDYPKIWVVRETDEVRGRRYGPFLSALELRDAVKILQRIFRFATCRIEMREADTRRRFFRPCLLHAIERCTAPCADRIGREPYAADVASLERFFKGERDPLLKDLNVRMKDASKELEFERAAELRDQMHALRQLGKSSASADYLVGDITPIDPKEGLDDLGAALRLEHPPRSIEGIDIAHLSGDDSVGSLVSFVDGIPFKAGYRRYRIKTVRGIDDYAMIREVVRRRFRKKEEEHPAPEVLLIDGGVGQLAAAHEALASADSAPAVLLSLAKREERLYRWTDRPTEVPMDPSAPALRLLRYVRDESHRFAQHYHHLLRHKGLKGEV